MNKKNFILTVVFLTLWTTFGQAQDQELFQFSGWGRAVVTPLASSDGDTSVSAATNTWADNARVGFTVKGTAASKNIGFVADLTFDGAVPGVGDNAKVWVKPFDFLKITAGAFKEDDFRGKVGASEFTSWLLPSGGFDEDAIFQRFTASAGAHVALTPLEGISIEAAFGSNSAGVGGQRANRNLIGNSLADVYKAAQVGVGYSVPHQGMVRAQFLGNNRAEVVTSQATNNLPVAVKMTSGLADRLSDRVEAAVQVTAIEGLNLDLGIKMPFAFDTDVAMDLYPAVYDKAASYVPLTTSNGQTTSIQQGNTASVGVVYNPDFLPEASLLARADYSSGTLAKVKGLYQVSYGSLLNVWVRPTYKVNDVVKVGTDLAMELKDKDVYKDGTGKVKTSRTAGSDHLDLGVGGWVELSVGGGTVKTGVLVMLPGNARYTYNTSLNSASPYFQTFSGAPVVTVPVSITYSF